VNMNVVTLTPLLSDCGMAWTAQLQTCNAVTGAPVAKKIPSPHMDSATARCVDGPVVTTRDHLMLSRDTETVQAAPLTVPMLMESVSHTLAHDNTSGHLQLQLLQLTHATVPALAVPISTPTSLHLLAMTTAVNMNVVTLTPLLSDCGMAWTAQLQTCNAVTGAPGSVRSSPNRLLMTLNSDCVLMSLVAMKMCTLSTFSSTSSDCNKHSLFSCCRYVHVQRLDILFVV